MLPSSELNDKFEKQQHAKLKYQTEMFETKKKKLNSVIPLESQIYHKSNKTSKILNNLDKYFRVKLSQESEAIKMQKLRQDQRNMIKLFKSMTKLQKYKTIKRIMSLGVFDEEIEFNIELMTETSDE